MKETWKKIQDYVYSVLWFLIGVTFVLFMVAADQAHQLHPCKSLKIDINHDQGNYFVDQQDVQALIEQHLGGNILGMPIGSINLETLEAYLEHNHYVENAEVYVDLNSTLWVKIAQRSPLARVIDVDNQSYYISKEGDKMPVSRVFSSRVPVISGYFKDNGKTTGLLEKSDAKEVYELLLQIHNDPFLDALVEQIYVEQEGDLILIPKIGNLEIEFGAVERVDEKFKTLKTLYLEGMNGIGWNKYKSVSLKYEGQIVCKKK